MRFILLLFIAVTLLPSQSFAFEDSKPSASVGYEAGKISRFQREVYVPGGPNTAKFSAWGKSFDATMDELEGMMADKIRENNEIAAKQQAIPGYSF